MVKDLESEISATTGRAKGVTPERLSKIWSVDIEIDKRTIDLTVNLVSLNGVTFVIGIISLTRKKSLVAVQDLLLTILIKCHSIS